MTGRVTPKKSTGTQKVSSAAEWKKASLGTPLVVPSGLTCMVRPMGMDALMRSGVIPNSLREYVIEALQKDKPPSQRQEINIDASTVTEEKLQEILDLFDTVCMKVVVNPKMHPAPAGEEERDDELLYIDEVDFNDKTFIFQFAIGGTRDVEKFRKGLAASMADVQNVQDDVVPAESTTGDQ